MKGKLHQSGNAVQRSALVIHLKVLSSKTIGMNFPTFTGDDSVISSDREEAQRMRHTSFAASAPCFP